VPDATADTTYNTPSLASVIQEIIDLPFWQSGNSIQILLNTASSTDTRQYHSYNGDPTKAPLLHLDWTYYYYNVNEGAEVHGVRANWQRVPKRKRADGVIEHYPYAFHTWDIPEMDMTTHLALSALKGRVLSSLTTTNINNRNSLATYTGAEMVSMVNGKQQGLMMNGVQIQFKVDVA
jgi:hypothetical protein